MKTPKKVASSSRSSSRTVSTVPKISRTQWNTSVLGLTLPNVYGVMVPEYASRSYSHLCLRVAQWTDSYGIAMSNISARRVRNRIANYLDPAELERVAARLEVKDSASIRFGVKKDGHGYHGERGDFCLSSGAIDGKHLTMFYRSLELIGGLAYDLALIAELSAQLGIAWKSVTIHAAHANVFALKGNSNEKLYPKFREILGI